MCRAVWPLILVLSALVVSIGCGGARPPVPSPPEEEDPLAERYDVPCRTAFRYAAKAMETRHYRITAVDMGGSGGTVSGASDDVGEIQLRLDCNSEGVQAEASGSGDIWRNRGLMMSFRAIVREGDRIWPPPKGPRVFVEQIRGPESKIYFPQKIDSAGMTALQVRIVNGSDRGLVIVPSRIRATRKGGGRLTAIDPEEVVKRFGGTDPDIGRKVIDRTTLGPGEELRGYFFFPAADYERATIVLVDEPTGEADEYSVSLEN